MYAYYSGGDVSRFFTVVEINLPSGVKPDMCDVVVTDGGSILELEWERPQDILGPKIFFAKWISKTVDGTLGFNDACFTKWEFVDRKDTSTARFFLDEPVGEKWKALM